MVVAYGRASGELSWKTCFVSVPAIILQCHGSVVPYVLPQLCFISGLGVLACMPGCNFLVAEFGGSNSSQTDGRFGPRNADLGWAMQIIGILLSFLLVFKTQTAHGQFWQAPGVLKEFSSCRETKRALGDPAGLFSRGGEVIKLCI